MPRWFWDADRIIIKTTSTAMKAKDFLKAEDLFFGIIHLDGTKSSLDYPVSIPKLESLWETRLDLFRHRCSCGEKACFNSHTVLETEEGRGTSFVHYRCPHCGNDITVGSNYILMRHMYEMLKP